MLRFAAITLLTHNASVPDFGFEGSLLFCLLLNAAVFASAWVFAARRLTLSRSQALLDGALFGYAVQYAAVGLAGMLGCLDLRYVSGLAMCFVVAFLAAAWKPPRLFRLRLPLRDRLIAVGVILFVIGFVLAFAHSQADLPVISNDAMTYHFPAAVQWIQQGRIGLFQTWFFNPANTFSPLAGSIFIAWLLLPFGTDLLARFVEIPALLCVGLALYQLCRQLRVRATVSILIAGAAVLSRPLLTPCMMGKDDLFVVFFFATALVALSSNRSTERFGGIRFGIAIGLLLATKYTTLFSVPILLLAIDSPRWKIRGWMTAIAFSIALAGPWYLRNWVLTGNPLFPLAIGPLFRGMFTTNSSSAFHTLRGAFGVATGGQYGLPILLLIVLVMVAVVCVGRVLILFLEHSSAPRAAAKKEGNGPLLRTCVFGTIVGFAIFFWRSPFPEVRFLLPVFVLMFACCGVAIDWLCPKEKFAIMLSIGVFFISLATLFAFPALTAGFAAMGLIVAATGCVGYWWAGSQHWRWAMLGIIGACAFALFARANWSAYCRDYLANQYDPGSGYDQLYPELNQLWGWMNLHLPVDAKVAYTNLYFVYPMQGSALRRRMVYIPTRPGLGSLADLPWLGDRLTGEQIVSRSIQATVAKPDRQVWLKNLRNSRCAYLVIGHGGLVGIPPEQSFADSDPAHFKNIFTGHAGNIYAITLLPG